MGPAGLEGGSTRVLAKLNEGLLLLGLTIVAAKAGDVSAAQEGTDSQEEPHLGLWEVEKRLFRDNESARGVLAELNIETLTEAEARAVLERRVEIGS